MKPPYKINWCTVRGHDQQRFGDRAAAERRAEDLAADGTEVRLLHPQASASPDLAQLH